MFKHQLWPECLFGKMWIVDMGKNPVCPITVTLYISISIFTDSREGTSGAARGPESKGMPPPFPYIYK